MPCNLIFGRLFVSLGRARRGELRGLFNGLNKNYIKEPDMRVFSLFIAIGLISGSASASAANFSFIGNLNQDDSVQDSISRWKERHGKSPCAPGLLPVEPMPRGKL